MVASFALRAARPRLISDTCPSSTTLRPSRCAYCDKQPADTADDGWRRPDAVSSFQPICCLRGVQPCDSPNSPAKGGTATAMAAKQTQHDAADALFRAIIET